MRWLKHVRLTRSDSAVSFAVRNANNNQKMVAWSKLDERKKTAFFEAFLQAIVEKKGDDIPNQRPASVKTLASFLADDKKFDHVSFGAGASYKTMIEEFNEFLVDSKDKHARALRTALRSTGSFTRAPSSTNHAFL